MRQPRLVNVLVLAASLALAAPSHAEADPTPSSKCVPFKPPTPYPDMNAWFAYLDSLSNADLERWYYENTTAPAAGADPFPLAGCTMGWVPGRSIAADVARIPGLAMGWSGKCFGFEYDAATATPTSLLNAFSANYEDASLPMTARVAGFLGGKANVLWAGASVDPRTQGAVWAFDYSPAAPLHDPMLGIDVMVNSIRDEVRQVAPGAVLGRMYIRSGDGGGGGEAVQYGAAPVYFWLGQACKADGTFAAIPAARQLPLLGAGRR